MTDQAFSHTSSRTIRRRGPERLFAFVRMADRVRMSCDLRFDGQSSSWEVQFLERDELMYRRQGFATRTRAVQWAEDERKKMEAGGI